MSTAIIRQPETGISNWRSGRMHSYGAGKTDLLADALPLFERTLLQCALNYSNGHKQDAARPAGLGTQYTDAETERSRD
ncbi:nitrogen regulation protein NR(I) [Morganella morganii]|nr:nitrogen regulation protein NR(I) [Morganella morganii]